MFFLTPLQERLTIRGQLYHNVHHVNVHVQDEVYQVAGYRWSPYDAPYDDSWTCQ